MPAYIILGVKLKKSKRAFVVLITKGAQWGRKGRGRKERQHLSPGHCVS